MGNQDRQAYPLQTQRNTSAMNDESQKDLSLALAIVICLVAFVLTFAAFIPQMPLWLAVLLAVGIGLLSLPFLIKIDKSNKHFWPEWKTLWIFCAYVALGTGRIAPLVLFLPLLWLVPAGDNWPIVVARISLIVTLLATYYFWVPYVRRTLPRLFRGRIPDETIDSIFQAAPKTESPPTLARAIMSWDLLVFAALAIFVFWGVVHWNNPALQVGAAPRRLRGAIRIILWCQGNPNTTQTAAVIVGLGSLAMYVYRIVTVFRQASEQQTEPKDTIRQPTKW
jgi:hypothetical protein